MGQISLESETLLNAAVVIVSELLHLNPPSSMQQTLVPVDHNAFM